MRGWWIMHLLFATRVFLLLSSPNCPYVSPVEILKMKKNEIMQVFSCCKNKTRTLFLKVKNSFCKLLLFDTKRLLMSCCIVWEYLKV
jgi:hypothetical protein